MSVGSVIAKHKMLSAVTIHTVLKNTKTCDILSFASPIPCNFKRHHNDGLIRGRYIHRRRDDRSRKDTFQESPCCSMPGKIYYCIYMNCKIKTTIKHRKRAAARQRAPASGSAGGPPRACSTAGTARAGACTPARIAAPRCVAACGPRARTPPPPRTARAPH